MWKMKQPIKDERKFEIKFENKLLHGENGK